MTSDLGADLSLWNAVGGGGVKFGSLRQNLNMLEDCPGLSGVAYTAETICAPVLSVYSVLQV